ncbi:uncharacterized protein FIBRA_02764 [Fibroporia radiculosa]|uniref:isoleucine--tRNA ligase n=1 Tax=Fibroporia radiculosa TaxID=599839 RepID=J4H213_9APHY|nr:uncharacterized protein FIBRA_02764 [Fibroporia radiculosa]CCM00724.1 predicted protein [Fibroporia radiculosa]
MSRSYMPGWDCHGLPIENKVLQQLGKRPTDLTPSVIREKAEAFARQEICVQQDQFRQFGIMADWRPESTYRSLDHDYETRQLRIFQRMVEKGLIYRHYRPVYFSPSSCSALAEAELTYNDNHVSHSVYIAFKLELDSPQMSPMLRALITHRSSVRLLVWTTTPWTLTANMAIAVNPEMIYKAVASSDDPTAPLDIFAVERECSLIEHPEVLGSHVPVAEIRGSELVGGTYQPLFSSLKDSPAPSSLPIIPSSHVTPDSGTGLVHCAPAHGAEDYLVFRALDMLSPSSSTGSLLCHVDHLGQFTDDVADVVGVEAATSLIGKEVLSEGSKAIVELIDATGALRKIHRIRHRYPYDWRTDKPVITIATSQWFANIDQIKGNAVLSLQDVQFVPPQSRNRLESYVQSRSEWCISRQRVWGVPIPALHHIPSGRAVLDSDSLTHILGVLQEKGTQYWWSGPVEEFIPPAMQNGMDVKQLTETWRKSTDTMDVWFDSGTSWSMLDSLYPLDGTTGSNGRQFGSDVSLEGTDQHRGWFQSQLLTAIGTADATGRETMAPYGTLITHGMVLDESGRKMSKSLGNVVDPMTIIHGGKDLKKEPAYGTEVLRLWVATVEFTKDMHIGPTLLAQCAETLRKIRNSARFILGVLEDQPLADRIERKSLGLALVNALSNFANITLSALYLDIQKDCLYANARSDLERRATLTVLEQALITMTSVMTPILPYLSMEIHDALRASPLSHKWKPLSSEWEDDNAERDMNELLRIRNKVLSTLEKARRDKNLKSSLEADAVLTLPPGSSHALDVLRREEPFLKTLFIVSGVKVSDGTSILAPAPSWQYQEVLPVDGLIHPIHILIQPAAGEAIAAVLRFAYALPVFRIPDSCKYFWAACWGSTMLEED